MHIYRFYNYLCFFRAGETRKLTLSKSMKNNKVIKTLELDMMSITLIHMLEPSSFGYDLPPVEVFQNSMFSILIDLSCSIKLFTRT